MPSACHDAIRQTAPMGQTFTTEIQARYRDINLAGHVDNVEAVRVLDEARYEFLRSPTCRDCPRVRPGCSTGSTPGCPSSSPRRRSSTTPRCGSCPTSRSSPRSGSRRIGRSSFTVAAELRVEAGGGPAAVWECVNVLWDHTAQSAWPISDAVRADLERYARRARRASAADAGRRRAARGPSPARAPGPASAGAGRGRRRPAGCRATGRSPSGRPSPGRSGRPRSPRPRATFGTP